MLSSLSCRSTTANTPKGPLRQVRYTSLLGKACIFSQFPKYVTRFPITSWFCRPKIKILYVVVQVFRIENADNQAGGLQNRQNWGRARQNGYLNTSTTLKKQTNDIIIYKHTQSPFIHLCFSCWYIKDNSLNTSSFLGNIRFIIIVRIT